MTMICRLHQIPLPLLVALTVTLSPSQSVSAAPAIVTDTAVIVGANSNGPYFVSGFFIMSGSESIEANSQTSIAYTLDANNGRISFARSLTTSDTVHLIFQRLGFALRSRWSREEPQSPTADFLTAPISFKSPKSPMGAASRTLTVPSRLQWQGHKSFSVTATDSRNSDWSQGLELGVEGELLDGLRLSAALSDRQIGQGSAHVGANGSRVGDLDRFFIEAESKKFRGRWGETRLSGRGTASRRVSGLETSVRAGKSSFKSYVARPQGEFRRRQISLHDAVLGPYTLSGSTAHANIVDGSQVVWLRGDRLAEGEDADYTIDVARGTLSLTPRVRFSRQDQLVIEYEESLDDYQRTMAGGSWGWQAADSSVRHSMSLSWEGDDPSRPLYGSLTDEQREILGQSSSGQVQLPSAERVGEYDGDYTLNVSAEGNSTFVYAGPDQGDWDVQFQWVGEGQGSYRHLVDNVYEYAGDSLGSYAPTLTLRAPSAEAVIEESLSLATHRLGQISLDWQGIGVDGNRLSGGSSYIRSNHSLDWSLGDAGSSQNSFARVTWISQADRADTRNFGLSLAHFANTWRLRGDLLNESYDSYSTATRLAAAKWLTIESGAERFESASLDGWRSASMAKARPSTWLMIEQQVIQRWITSLNSNDSRTSHIRSKAQIRTGAFTTEAGMQSEDVDDPTRQFTFDTDAGLSRWLSVSRDGLVARQEWRRAHDLDQNRTEHHREFSIGLPATILGAISGAGLTALRGDRSIDGGPTEPYYGGRLNSSWNLRDNLQVSADVDLSHRIAGTQREVFIPTRPGQGDYRLERGEYIPDQQGDYRRVFVDDENGDEKAYDARKSIRVNWRPNWQGWRWAFDASRRIDARYSSASFAAVDWLVPWTELSDALLPGARLTLRDDHRLSVHPRTLSRMTVLLVHEHQLFRSAHSTRDDAQRFWRIESEWREDLSAKAYIAVATQYHRRTRDGSPLSAIDSDARALLTTFGISPAQGVGVSLEMRHRLDREFTSDDLLTLWGVRPSTRVNIGAFNASLSTDLTWLDGESIGYLSPLIAEGRPLGFSFTEAAEVRWQLPSRISLNARVSGDHRPNAPDRWRMHIETVASF